MSDYDLYVKEIKNVFEIFKKIKEAWDNNDNLEFVEEFISYKDEVISAAKIIQHEKPIEKEEG